MCRSCNQIEGSPPITDVVETSALKTIAEDAVVGKSAGVSLGCATCGYFSIAMTTGVCQAKVIKHIKGRSTASKDVLSAAL